MPRTRITEVSNIGDRRALFLIICKTMCLDPEAEAKKLDIKSTPAGLMVSIEQLLLFFKEKKLSGEFDFEEGSITVTYPLVHSKGKKAIENPETIKNTSVDEENNQKAEKEKKEEIIKEGTGPKPGQDLSKIEIDDDDDDDDLPF